MNAKQDEITRKAQEAAKAAAPAKGSGGNTSGRIVLPNGEMRADYIHRRYYDDKVDRGTIVREINHMYEQIGDTDTVVQYQAVYSATKGDDPRVQAGQADQPV